MKRFIALTVLSLSISPVAAGELPTTEEVLGRFVDAVGGAPALDATRERHYRGTIVQDLNWEDPQHSETPFIAWADAEGLVRYAETADWAELPAEDAADLRSKLRWIFHPRFALVVEDFFPGLVVDRRETREGRPVVVLVPEGLRPEYFSLYFDEESGLLSHIGYHNWLQDWQESDGILYPHRWVFGRKGGQTTYQWETVANGPAPTK